MHFWNSAGLIIILVNTAPPFQLAAYKKKRERSKNNSESASTSPSSDNSLSLTPQLLPDNSGPPQQMDQEHFSDSSIISEHIVSSNESVENDRSFQEIEIFNVPNDLLFRSDTNVMHISQEGKPASLNLTDTSGSNFEAMDKIVSPNKLEVTHNVQSILEEILKNEQFKSESEHTIRKSDNSLR